MISVRALLRSALPLPVRLAARRAPAIVAHAFAPRPFRLGRGERAAFEHLQASRATPLRRAGAVYGVAQQRAKEINVRRCAELLDGAWLPPGSTFSWHRYVGPPLSVRGFREGPELRADALALGVGGGACQV